MMTGLDENKILQALHILSNQKRGKDRTLFEVFDYTSPNVSEKVVRIILSYTDYVNKNVWKKY
jgi:UDP-N-acetylglucosamine 2-epimerase (non-hydrolysing)